MQMYIVYIGRIFIYIRTFCGLFSTFLRTVPHTLLGLSVNRRNNEARAHILNLNVYGTGSVKIWKTPQNIRIFLQCRHQASRLHASSWQTTSNVVPLYSPFKGWSHQSLKWHFSGAWHDSHVDCPSEHHQWRYYAWQTPSLASSA